MSIGYACLAIGVANTDFRSSILKNATEANLTQLVDHNLKSLKNIIDYNIAAGIHLFRISSDIVPFGSHPSVDYPWREMYKEYLSVLGEKIKSSKIRVSMHPGQYTVLNSPDTKVLAMAIEDLRYHVSFLDSLGTDKSNKMVLHIGGVYGDKKTAMQRFAEHYRDLDEAIKNRLIIENDDKSYHIGDVLELGTKLGIPVVYDNLHNAVNCCDSSKDDAFWISECAKTWKKEDGKQKIHYSEQNGSKKAGSHSDKVKIAQFMDFYNRLSDAKPDIMLEVKDKNLSAVKCINCTSGGRTIKDLELEWSRYKYLVLENSPSAYNQVRALLKDKTAYPAVSFYELIDSALETEASMGSRINAALHVWGYFKEIATDKEKTAFQNKLDDYASGKASVDAVKRILQKLAEKYNQKYLLDAYYFMK